MKNHKILKLSAITFILFTVIASCPVLGKSLDSYSKIAASVRPSVVTVLVYDFNGKLKHIGSGFFYNQKGDILTNSHVLLKNTRAEIKTQSGEKYPVGQIIERDEKTDIVKARTHIPMDLPFLKLAKRPPAVGDRIMVAGSPMGLEQTITEGIVSAWRKIPKKGRVLQISAPISPGSSGGPVLNMQGKVVGIATFQMIQGQNLNFAVPVDSIVRSKKSGSKKLKFHTNKKGVIVIE